MKTLIVHAGFTSRPETTRVVGQMAAWLLARGHRPRILCLPDLPANALLGGWTDEPRLQAALAAVQEADALVFASGDAHGFYGESLQAFLDLLPFKGLAGKTVLPVAPRLADDYGTAGSALVPALEQLGARVLETVALESWPPSLSVPAEPHLQAGLGALLASGAGLRLPLPARAGFDFSALFNLAPQAA